jgi:translation initiation factor 3 subunit D
MYGSSQNAGLQFDYIHDNEEVNFQLVGTVKPQKPQRMFRRNNAAPFRKIMQKDIERRELQYYNQSNKMKRSIAKEQMRAYKLWQRRGGARNGPANRGTGTRRFGDRQGNKRVPSVQVRPDWKILQELDFQRLSKLSLPNRKPVVDM